MNRVAEPPCRFSSPDAGPCANCYLLGRKCKGGAHNREGKAPPTKAPLFDVHLVAQIIAYMIVVALVVVVAAAMWLGVGIWLRAVP